MIEQDLQEEMDRRFVVVEREQGMLAEQAKMLVKAEHDRTDVRFQERDTATRVAEEEREKSAKALGASLARGIQEGDERLREHISNQVSQINASLLSAELLEMQRIALTQEATTALDAKVAGLFEEKQKALDAALTAQKEAVVKAEVATDRIAARAQTDQEGLRADMQERLAAVRRELEQATAAQKEAVLKAEAANEKRFESTNEWRGQSQDRERSQAEQRVRLEATFMQREVADVQFSEMRKQIDMLSKTAAANVGRYQERAEHGVSSDRTIAMVGVFIAVISAISFIVYAVSIHH